MLNMDTVDIRMEALRIASGDTTLAAAGDLLTRAEAIYQFIVDGQTSRGLDAKSLYSADDVAADESREASVVGREQNGRAVDLDPAWDGFCGIGDRTWRCYAVLNNKNELIDSFRRENDLSVQGAANAIEWREAFNDRPFMIYAFDAETGNSGYLGTTANPTFVDRNIEPDCTVRLGSETIALAEMGGPFTPF